MRMKKKDVPKFLKEADLCKVFIADVAERARDWTAYAETAGWDILLVRKDGVQLGIEAKLKLNAKVVSQALKDWRYHTRGPDYRAVLVPRTEVGEMEAICDHVGVYVMKQRHPEERHYYSYVDLPDPAYTNSRWHPWCPIERCRLPEYVPDVVAGDSAPMTLSRWKISAIKVQVLLEDGPVHRADIKALGLNPSRWFDKCSGFLKPTPSGYVASDYMPDFSRQHPTNYAQIKADRSEWIKTVRAGALALVEAAE